MITKAKPATVKKVAVKKPAARTGKAAAKASPAASKGRVAQPLKKDKPEKEKMVRDSFSMPESDYATLIALKKKCMAAGVHVKKSELLRLGLLQLSKLASASLVTSAKRIASDKKKRTVKA
jgi:hypothetical protein